MYLERPEGMTLADAEGFAAVADIPPLANLDRPVVAVPEPWQTVGHLYRGWRAAAAALIEAAIPADTALPESWPACALLLPHAQAALTDESDGMGRLALDLRYRGWYAAALELQQQVLHARKRILGAEHPSTLTARANLADFTGAAGGCGRGP
jgi:hypothetical protein